MSKVKIIVSADDASITEEFFKSAVDRGLNPEVEAINQVTIAQSPDLTEDHIFAQMIDPLLPKASIEMTILEEGQEPRQEFYPQLGPRVGNF